MPKTQEYVEVNHGGEWVHALIMKTISPENFQVEYWIGSDRQEIVVAKGTAPGMYREPQD